MKCTKVCMCLLCCPHKIITVLYLTDHENCQFAEGLSIKAFLHWVGGGCERWGEEINQNIQTTYLLTNDVNKRKKRVWKWTKCFISTGMIYRFERFQIEISISIQPNNGWLCNGFPTMSFMGLCADRYLFGDDRCWRKSNNTIVLCLCMLFFISLKLVLHRLIVTSVALCDIGILFSIRNKFSIWNPSNWHTHSPPFPLCTLSSLSPTLECNKEILSIKNPSI